jgi:hypothetical protein
MAESAPSGRLAARFDGLDSFMQRRAHAFELCRQFEDRCELLVPADELQVLVDDRDTPASHGRWRIAEDRDYIGWPLTHRRAVSPRRASWVRSA